MEYFDRSIPMSLMSRSSIRSKCVGYERARVLDSCHYYTAINTVLSKVVEALASMDRASGH